MHHQVPSANFELPPASPLPLPAPVAGTDQSLQCHSRNTAFFSNPAFCSHRQPPGDLWSCGCPRLSFPLGRISLLPAPIPLALGAFLQGTPTLQATPPTNSQSGSMHFSARRWPCCACVKRALAVRRGALLPARPSPNHRHCRPVCDVRSPSVPVPLP